jgi:hypothetical protein
MGLNSYTSRESGGLSLGQAGFDYVTGTNASGEGSWVAFTAVGGDAVFASTVVSAGDALPEGFVLAEGVTVYGPFTQYQLTSGVIIAYRG